MITAIRFKGVGISAYGSLLTGGTSAFARNAVGFVCALERKLQDRQCTLGLNRRVAVGVENYALHKGGTNASTSKINLSRPWDGKSANVLDYEWKCNATITLLIQSDGVDDIDALQTALRLEIPSMRFANGSIFMVHNADTLANVHAGNASETLKKAIRSVKASRSSFLVCREDLVVTGDEFNSFTDALALFELSPQQNGDDPHSSLDFDAESDLDESAEPIQLEEDDEDSEAEAEKKKNAKKNWIRKQPGWIVPVERGYLAVTKPVRNRPGSRDANLDSYVVTPVISLGEYISTKRMLKDLNQKAFWKSESDRSVGSFLFSSTSFND